VLFAFRAVGEFRRPFRNSQKFSNLYPAQGVWCRVGSATGLAARDGVQNVTSRAARIPAVSNQERGMASSCALRASLSSRLCGIPGGNSDSNRSRLGTFRHRLPHGLSWSRRLGSACSSMRGQLTRHRVDGLHAPARARFRAS